MKPAICYGIRNNYGMTEILEITSKEVHYFYGRTLTGARTSGLISSLLGVTMTLETATKILKDVEKIRDEYEPQFRESAKLRRDLYKKQKKAINKLFEQA